MRDHVCLAVADRAASEACYDTVPATLGVARAATTTGHTAWDGFRIVAAGDGRPPTRNLHIGFAAPGRALFRGASSSFSVVAGPPRTEHVHLEFALAGARALSDPDGNTVRLDEALCSGSEQG